MEVQGTLKRLVIGALVVAAAIAVAASAEKLASGQLLSYTPQRVDRWRLFGFLELYVDRERLGPLDVLNGLILAAGAGIALLTATLLGGELRVRRFFWLLALGFSYLALDEQLGAHETIGFNLAFLADLPGVHSPEDVVFALYAIPALAVLVHYRSLIASDRVGLRLVLAGLMLFASAALLDVADSFLDEQWLEVPSSLALVSGFTLIALRYLKPVLRPTDFAVYPSADLASTRDDVFESTLR